MSVHSIQIELEGLITLLARNLYADPDVFLREMLQNAHDSITKRRELADMGAGEAVPPGQIRIAIDRDAQALRIHDNGSGLTEQEIHDYLATIGRSGTDELRQQLRVGRDDGRGSVRERAIDLIGQFGIGLLSAFIVADEVEVVTRASGASGYRWRSTGSRDYSVEPADKREVGTTVVLRLRPTKARYLEHGRLARIVRRYADFLGVPVFIDEPDADRGSDEATEAEDGGGEVPVNAVHAPWHREHDDEHQRRHAVADFWDRRFPDEVALDVLALSDSFHYIDPERPEQPRHAQVHGVLAITDRHVPDVNTRGTVDLYISRMFICSGNRDILPPWARFIQGVLECDGLLPNAARDNVVRNAALEALGQHLGQRIIAWLSELSSHHPERFKRIMRWHSYHILAMSVQDAHDDFFRAIADMVPLSTDRGPLTMPEYLQAMADAPEVPSVNLPGQKGGEDETAVARGQAVYYITESGSARQYFMLCAARGLRVFDCGEPFAERFLFRYRDSWPERVHLRQLDIAQSAAIFSPLEEAESERFQALALAYKQLFADGRVLVRIERYAPTEIPAVITEARDSRSRRQMQDLVVNPTVPGFLRDMVTDFLEQREDPVTLHLNADNPTVQRLAAGTLGEATSRVALMTLHNNAMMLAGRSLPGDAMRAMFAQYNELIDLVLSQGEELVRYRAEAAQPAVEDRS